MGEAVVAWLDPVVGEPGVAGIELAPGKARLLHLVEAELRRLVLDVAQV